MDGFCQVAVLRHVPDLELLHHDDVMAGDQFVALFVQEVLALVSDLLMAFCNFCFRFPAVFDPFFLWESLRCSLASFCSDFLRNLGVSTVVPSDRA